MTMKTMSPTGSAEKKADEPETRKCETKEITDMRWVRKRRVIMKRDRERVRE